MEFIRILILLFALFAWSRVVINLKTRKFSLIEFILWSIIWLSLIVVDIFPTILSTITRIFGTSSGTGLLVYLSIILIFYLVYRISSQIDEHRKAITKLTRHIAIIDAELREIKESKGKHKKLNLSKATGLSKQRKTKTKSK